MSTIAATTEEESDPHLRPIETLSIRGFAGLNVDLEFADINLLIGPQASGKSVCARVLFFFQTAIGRIIQDVMSGLPLDQTIEQQLIRFQSCLPGASTEEKPFQIHYNNGSHKFSIIRTTGRSHPLGFVFTEEFRNKLQTDLQNYHLPLNLNHGIPEAILNPQLYYAQLRYSRGYFVPSGRSYFTSMASNIWAMLANAENIDPYFAEFGMIYQSLFSQSIKIKFTGGVTDKFEERADAILCGNSKFDSDHAYIVTRDGRKVNMRHCSSGQQEAFPLLLLLRKILENPELNGPLVIEEPEAHLFPPAQQEMVKVLVDVQTKTNSQLVLTTHSPYILSELNNLLYAGIVALETKHPEAVTGIIGSSYIQNPSKVRAYYLEDGHAESIIDGETRLIFAEKIDDASEKGAMEFDKLRDLMLDAS